MKKEIQKLKKAMEKFEKERNNPGETGRRKIDPPKVENKRKLSYN